MYRQRISMQHVLITLMSGIFIAGCGASSNVQAQPTSSPTTRPTLPPAATQTPATPALDATYTSPDGLFSFKYNQATWSDTPVSNTDFPAGSGLITSSYYLFYTLPATRAIAAADDETVITAFLKNAYTSFAVGQFSPGQITTLGANTWTVETTQVYADGVQGTATVYTLLHNGKTFFIVTIAHGAGANATYFQPMIASFVFLK